jgi:hypothetical protein
VIAASEKRGIGGGRGRGLSLANAFSRMQ